MIKKKKTNSRLKKITRNFAFQRAFLVIITVLISFILIQTGALPKKYRLSVGDVSTYDITAPRDLVNEVLTEKIESLQEIVLSLLLRKIQKLL